MENQDYQNAFDTVFKKLKDDKALYYAWQSNIAMCFVDKLQWVGYRFPEMNKLANESAESFLNMLIKKINE